MSIDSHGVDVRFSREERLRSRRLPAVAAGLAFVAATLIGAACSAPIPTPTPTPTPTATPTPQPASYRISYDGARFGAAADGLVETELLLSLTNTGELDGINVPVSVSVDGEAARASDPIVELGAGESTSLVIAHSLSPGDHDAVFRVGGSELRETVSVPAADIALALEGYAVAGDRLMIVDVHVKNGGGLDAENIVVSAEWRPLPGADGMPGRMEAATTLDRVAAGGSGAASFTLPIPTGAYTLTLTASTLSPEAVTDDNAVRRYLEVEYAQLTVEVAAEQVTGYETDGDGRVELTLRVTNAGVGPTGPLTVGAACAERAPAPCEAAGAVHSIAPSESAEAVVTLGLPQGENGLTVYAGANEDTYRWGERNAVAHAVTVPQKSVVELELIAPMEVSGYWADGTASVETAITVANDGYMPLTDPVDVTVVCYRDGAASGAPETGCGGVTSVALADGFGPETVSGAYRVPMGVTLRALLPDDAQATTGIIVPERILGVERDIWECYSDRPNWKPTRENNFLGGCAGWTEPTVIKWQPGLPVRVWADPSGDRRYVDILRESLDELAPLLGLDVEWVASETEANLKAYVGVPASRTAAIGFAGYCQDAAGCGGPRRFSGDAITSGRLSVWLDDDDSMRVKNVTLHEILHAVTGVHHASNPSSIMSYANWDRPSLGVEDATFYRIHGHPLVEPGMTLAEVEERIVLTDELLDPPAEEELDGIALAERAYAALIEAGSARFRVHGGWGGSSGCANNTFNGRLGIGDFASGSARLLNFDRGYDQLVVAYAPDAGWRYWRGSGGVWTLTTHDSLFDGTDWRGGFTNPVNMLISVLRYADAEAIGVEFGAPGTLELSLTLTDHRNLPVNWARGAAIDIGITLDAETYAMTGYRMAWDFDVISSSSCRLYQVTATEGQHGVDIPDPR